MAKDESELPRAFVSYVSENSELVSRLVKELEVAGVEVFWAPEKMRVGDDWQHRILTTIPSCNYFVSCFSPEAASQDESYFWAENRIAANLAFMKPPFSPWIIVARLAECEVPAIGTVPNQDLGCLHRADLFGGPDAWPRGVDEVLAAMISHYERAPDFEHVDSRVKATVGLGRIGRTAADGRRAVEILEQLTADRDQEVRLRAIEALGASGRPEAARMVGDTVRNAEVDKALEAVEAVRAIARLNPPNAMQVLETALGHPDRSVRLEAVGQVAELGADLAEGVLMRVAQEPDPEVAQAAQRALRERGVVSQLPPVTQATVAGEAARLGEVARQMAEVLRDHSPEDRDALLVTLLDVWLDYVGAPAGSGAVVCPLTLQLYVFATKGDHWRDVKIPRVLCVGGEGEDRSMSGTVAATGEPRAEPDVHAASVDSYAEWFLSVGSELAVPLLVRRDRRLLAMVPDNDGLQDMLWSQSRPRGQRTSSCHQQWRVVAVLIADSPKKHGLDEPAMRRANSLAPLIGWALQTVHRSTLDAAGEAARRSLLEGRQLPLRTLFADFVDLVRHTLRWEYGSLFLARPTHNELVLASTSAMGAYDDWKSRYPGERARYDWDPRAKAPSEDCGMTVAAAILQEPTITIDIYAEEWHKTGPKFIEARMDDECFAAIPLIDLDSNGRPHVRGVVRGGRRQTDSSRTPRAITPLDIDIGLTLCDVFVRALRRRGLDLDDDQFADPMAPPT